MRRSPTAAGARSPRLTLTAAIVLASALLSSPAIGQSGAAKAPAGSVDVPRIAYTRVELKNGLVVLLSEDHSSPTATVVIWYHVGSKDDVPGKAGLAHMYEHMMFEGSARTKPQELDQFVKGAGGGLNAQTVEDRTNYYTTVPANLLESVLWYAADQMASGTSTLDSTRFAREREIVMSEFDVRYLSVAVDRGAARFFVTRTLFAGTPYATPSIGMPSELVTTSVQDLHDFFSRYTRPNNAVLSIVGDFKTADIRAAVERFFGGIPRGAAVTHPSITVPPLTKESRIVLEDRNQNNSHLWLAWIGASLHSRDQLPLRALAGILAGGPTARLTRALVDERHLAAAVPTGLNDNFDLEETGVFQLAVQARPGTSLTNIEVATDSVLADVRANGVTQKELDRWVKSFIVGTIIQMQTTRARAETLAEGQSFHGDPLKLFDDVGRVQQITVADVQRVAREYLVPGRVVLSIVPTGKLDLISKPTEPYANLTLKGRP